MLDRIRSWARSHTEAGRFTPVGQLFHWVMAVLMLFQLYWGWHVSRMPVGGDKLSGYQLHSDIGLLILVLATLRFWWRLLIPDPINDADKPGWQSKVAHWTAWAFYICFFGLPWTGWAMWSALGDGQPLQIAGVIPWPQLPFESLDTAWQWAIMDWSETGHQLLVVVLILLIPLHIGAALKHHFWDRHDVLEGMLPSIPDVQSPRGEPPHRQRQP
jgi:cytochrome b561